MRMRILLRRGLAVPLAAAVIGGSVGPAVADHEAPFDGPDHEYGEMVDYPLSFPVAGEPWFEDWFGASRLAGPHHAQDVFAPKGTPVYAAASGTVVRINSSWTSPTEKADGCCSIVIVHDDGWSTLYVHLDNDTPGTDDGAGWGIAPGIVIGGRVEAGQEIGYVGDSGTAEHTMPHLHFELRDPDGVIVNPYDSLLVAQGRSVCRVADPGPLDALLGSWDVITIGARGAAVRQAQRLAAAFGHSPGPIDGIFGPATKRAVAALQRDLGVGADGVIGAETRAAIAPIVRIAEHLTVLDPDGRIMRWGDVGIDVRSLQDLLVLAGHDPGVPDGVFGTKTEYAIQALQASAGLAVDGIVGPGTRRALGASLGVAPLVTCDA